MNQKPIILFPGVEMLPTLSKQHTIDYLKRYCTIDDLDDTIYVKKLGNDGTTFAIDFESDTISIVRKIKDKQGCNIEDVIFDGVDDESNNNESNNLIICPECNTKCETEYHLSEADEISDEEYIPIYSECSKCGWSVC